jgi:hypothetical protein
MANAADYIPAFKYGHMLYPQNMVLPNSPLDTGRVWFVDGDKSTGGAGGTWEDAFATIQAAIDAASAGDVIYVAAKTITALATDPVSYDEHLTIGNTKSNLSIIGVSRGLTQGGLPQIKPTTTVTGHVLTVRAPGCLIANLGFNGAGLTADSGYSGIYLEDDGGTTYVAFGTTIVGCHFKSLGRGHAGAAGAIDWSSNGGAWQTRIVGNRFYKCLTGINLRGTSSSIPQDVVIEGNWFGSAANTDTDCDIDLGNGSGVVGLVINNNVFATVDVPTHASGAVARYLDLTGCAGILSNNMFSCITGEGETEKTFGAAGTAALIPTTVRMANNWGETSTTGASVDWGMVFRT